MIDFLDAPNTALVHLIHPKSTPWTVLGAALSSELGVPLVPYNEWLAELEAAAKSSTSGIAALRLLGFFKHVGKQSEADSTCPETFGLPQMDTSNAVSLSRSLAEAKPLAERDALAWVGYWKAVGFI